MADAKEREAILRELMNEPEGELNRFIIFSGNFFTAESALQEIQVRQPGAKLVRWFAVETALVRLPEGVDAFYRALKENPSIYIQHFFPVKHVFPMDLEGLADQIAALYGSSIRSPFSVQGTAFDGNRTSTPHDLNKAVSDAVVGMGKTWNVKDPVQVISIVCHEGFAYTGLSTAEENLSKWACGKVRYAVSLNRAEYKLVECMDYFRLKLDGGDALDLGAAPGGWTKALCARGYRVWAVDPAELDGDIARLPGVTHLRETAQQFLRQNRRAFDIIVNDMVLDCRESAVIMASFADWLSQGGCGVFTAKLPKKGYQQRLKAAVGILEKRYVIRGIRQLPSNKSEVTVLLGRKREE